MLLNLKYVCTSCLLRQIRMPMLNLIDSHRFWRLWEEGIICQHNISHKNIVIKIFLTHLNILNFLHFYELRNLKIFRFLCFQMISHIKVRPKELVAELWVIHKDFKLIYSPRWVEKILESVLIIMLGRITQKQFTWSILNRRMNTILSRFVICLVAFALVVFDDIQFVLAIIFKKVAERLYLLGNLIFDLFPYFISDCN